LGEVRLPDPLEKDIPAHVWEMCLNAPPLDDNQPPEEIMALVQQRAEARTNKNWAESDKLRDEIAALGWIVQDSKEGYKLVKNF
jgi:cysteinyl-tRNA synthetase